MKVNKKVVDFIFEMGHLKRIRHEGWRLIGVDEPETVAAHSLRAAQIGYVLAKMSGYSNPHEIVTMLAFHDMAETRIGDLHKVAQRYVTADEEKVVKEQIETAPDVLSELLTLWQSVENRSNEAGNLAKDADLLEQAFTALEYVSCGFPMAIKWYDAVGKAIVTDVAKNLYASLSGVEVNDWWQDLKKY